MEMKLLSDILYKTGAEKITGMAAIPVNRVTTDSRKTGKSSLFIAVRGTRTDGHQFINDAVSGGAVAIVCEEMPRKLSSRITYVQVPDSRKSLGIIASNFFGNPSSKLKLIGITGTNGKTTTVTLLFQLFRSFGFHTGLISTVRYCADDKVIPATHTTPDPLALNALLAEMVSCGCTYCFMEVSSHAADQHRIAGLNFTGGVFTNITPDHLDYHKTFRDYILAKKKFFDELGSGSFALVNSDDRNHPVMLQNTAAKKYSYALKNSADFRCSVIESRFTGLQLNFNGRDVWTKLAGGFNASNLLAVYAVSILLGLESEKVLTVMSGLEGAEGRFQKIRNDHGTTGIVDYAHTPDALEKMLREINRMKEKDQQVITVVGCGGDRDQVKRPVMGRIAAEESDKVIFTSDNPRSEEAEAIIRQMRGGVRGGLKKKVLSVTDRREAIRTALLMAKDGDIILVAGKGHEKYQEIKGKKYPFDDAVVIKEIFETGKE